MNKLRHFHTKNIHPIHHTCWLVKQTKYRLKRCRHWSLNVRVQPYTLDLYSRVATMDIFVKIKRLLGVLGFERSTQPIVTIKNYIRRICCAVLITSMSLAIFWFVAFEAKIFTDLANPIFVLCNGFNCVVVYTAFLQRSTQFENLFDMFQLEILKRG